MKRKEKENFVQIQNQNQLINLEQMKGNESLISLYKQKKNDDKYQMQTKQKRKTFNHPKMMIIIIILKH